MVYITEGYMETSEKSWLAGFVDGEGCFHLANNRGCLSPQFHIANTNKPVMEHVARLLNAKDKLRKVAVHKKGWRCRWHVCICGAERIRQLLDDIEPFLVCKKEEVKVFRKILNTYSEKTRFRMTEEQHKERRRLWSELQMTRTKEWNE